MPSLSLDGHVRDNRLYATLVPTRNQANTPLSIWRTVSDGAPPCPGLIARTRSRRLHARSCPHHQTAAPQAPLNPA